MKINMIDIIYIRSIEYNQHHIYLKDVYFFLDFFHKLIVILDKKYQMKTSEGDAALGSREHTIS